MLDDILMGTLESRCWEHCFVCYEITVGRRGRSFDQRSVRSKVTELLAKLVILVMGSGMGKVK